MAVCLLNQDVLKSNFCGYSLGAFNRVYLANYEEVSATVINTENGQEVTGITMSDGKEWYKIDIAKNSGSWTDELIVTDAGAKYRTQTINFNIIAAYNKNMADVVDALSLGKYIAVIEKNDGTNVMLGRLAGLEASVATVGGSEDDSVVNGLQVTLTCNTAEVALPVSDNAMKTVKGGE